MVPLGSPVVPEVKPSSATSSRPVFTASNFTDLLSATRSSSASWLAVPSKLITFFRKRLSLAQATSSSAMRLSHSASETSALSTILVSSPARSSGMVLTATAPALVTASHTATMAGLLPERTSTRLPGWTPKSSTSACASRLLQSASSL